MIRARYRDGVAWIAMNDDPTVMDAAEIGGFVSTLLLADLFDVDPARVAADILRYRRRQADLESRRQRHRAEVDRIVGGADRQDIEGNP